MKAEIPEYIAPQPHLAKLPDSIQQVEPYTRSSGNKEKIYIYSPSLPHAPQAGTDM